MISMKDDFVIPIEQDCMGFQAHLLTTALLSLLLLINTLSPYDLFGLYHVGVWTALAYCGYRLWRYCYYEHCLIVRGDIQFSVCKKESYIKIALNICFVLFYLGAYSLAFLNHMYG